MLKKILFSAILAVQCTVMLGTTAYFPMPDCPPSECPASQ
jgi:hypothetical protein